MDWGRDERVVKVVLKEILEFVGDDELAVDHGWQEEHVGKVRVELFPYLLSLLKNASDTRHAETLHLDGHEHCR